MPILNDHFYHKTISFYTAVFGSVFSKLKVIREDGKEILVPISYAIKQKYDVRNTQNADPNASRYKMILPRLAFKMVNVRRDQTRSLNKFNILTEKGVDRTTANGLSVQYNRVPHIFDYTLSIKTKTVDDMMQILEQIYVYFNPSIRIVVKDNPDLNQDSALTLTLLDSNIDDMFEGMFDGEQILELNINFQLEGWLYMPTSNHGIIRTININYLDFESNLLDSTTITE